MSLNLPPIIQQLLGTITMLFATAIPLSVQAIVNPVLTILTTIQNLAVSGALSTCSITQLSTIISDLNTLVTLLIAVPIVSASIQATVSALITNILSLLPCAVTNAISCPCPCPIKKKVESSSSSSSSSDSSSDDTSSDFCESSSSDTSVCSSSSSGSSTSTSSSTFAFEVELEKYIDCKFEKYETRLKQIENDIKIIACTLYKLKTSKKK